MSEYKRKGIMHGAAHNRAKLNVVQVVEIFFSSDKEVYLAAVYHVSQATVNRIKTRQTWQHVTLFLDRSNPPKDSCNEDLCH